jgi:hypothetical protein
MKSLRDWTRKSSYLAGELHFEVNLGKNVSETPFQQISRHGGMFVNPCNTGSIDRIVV